VSARRVAGSIGTASCTERPHPWRSVTPRVAEPRPPREPVGILPRPQASRKGRRTITGRPPCELLRPSPGRDEMPHSVAGLVSRRGDPIPGSVD
jgi:hypothetical protein